MKINHLSLMSAQNITTAMTNNDDRKTLGKENAAALDKENAKRSNLLKFEATMLFTQIKNQLESSRWFFFEEARRQAFTIQYSRSISPYRASMHFRYAHCGVLYDAYLEREAHVGRTDECMWTLSFPGIEGKTNAQRLRDHLQTLRTEGFDIPNGEEYLDRQMNFSLGLYGACLMHVEVRFPPSGNAFACFCRIMDELQGHDDTFPADLNAMSKGQADEDADEANDELLIMGDWQTWK